MTISQYFVYKRPIAWTLLFATLAGGFAAFRSMPQRQDPVIQIRLGLVSTEYPRASPIEVEQEVSRKIEKKLAENPAVEHVRSTSRQGLSTVFADLYESTRNAEAVWQDLDNKLAAMTDLPVANGVPLKPRLDKDFGDTVAVMLTLSSPPVSDLEVERRAEVIAEKIREARAAGPSPCAAGGTAGSWSTPRRSTRECSSGSVGPAWNTSRASGSSKTARRSPSSAPWSSTSGSPTAATQPPCGTRSGGGNRTTWPTAWATPTSGRG